MFYGNHVLGPIWLTFYTNLCVRIVNPGARISSQLLHFCDWQTDRQIDRWTDEHASIGLKFDADQA